SGDRAGFGEHLRVYLGLPESWRPELVASADRRFTDASIEGPRLMETLSLINLATLADLSRRSGQPVDARRFRANLYIDGLPAWSEFDWIGREFSIGAVRFQGRLRTPRCAAIEANPDTGERDMALMKLMRAELKDHHCGIQIEAV